MELADPLMKSSRMSLPKRIKGIEFISRRKSSYEYRLNVCIIMSPWMNKWSVWCFGLAPECSILVWRTFDGHVLCCCQFRFDHSATRFPNPARQQSTDGTDDRVSFYEFPVVSVLWISGCDCRYYYRWLRYGFLWFNKANMPVDDESIIYSFTQPQLCSTNPQLVGHSRTDGHFFICPATTKRSLAQNTFRRIKIMKH